MHDMGEERNTSEVCCEPGGKKGEKHYPSMNLSSKKLPGLKGKKFGDTCEIYIKGKISGMHEDYDDKSEAMYDIKIIECGTKGKVSSEKYDKMNEYDKDKADEKEVMGE